MTIFRWARLLFLGGELIPLVEGESFLDGGAFTPSDGVEGDEVLVFGRDGADEVVSADDLVVFGEGTAEFGVAGGDFENDGSAVFEADEEGLRDGDWNGRGGRVLAAVVDIGLGG